ncbi:MAG: EamA family transporter [Desulfobacterales bacterium]|nr:DMT family transporter [Deltaproteobacteria bacterium]NNL75121.1 EamA family transporter [Desulfobacterales bacterium]
MKNQIKDQRLVQLDASVAGPLFMLSAALLFTLLNLLIKLIGPEFTVWHIGFYRFFGGMIVLLIIFGRHSNIYKGNNIRLLIIRGCTGSVAFICIITAIRLLPVSTALVIFYSFPAFAAIFSFLIYHERIGKLEILCITVVLIGIGVLFDFQLAGGLFGQTIAIVGGVFAGLTVTLIRTLRVNNGPVIIYLYFCTMGALVTLPKFIMQPILPSTPIEWVMILGIILASVTAQLLMNQGFFYCRGWEGGVFMSSEVILTAVVGIAFLGDPATWRFWTGGLMIFGSVVALNRLKANEKKVPRLK